MGFLDATGAGGVFVDVGDTEHKKTLRPLADKPQAIWGHAIPSPETAVTLSSGKAVVARLRDYHFEICTATNRRGIGCRICNRADTAWNFLSERDQTNRKGQRVDFPKRCQYIMPVWDYEAQEVKILRGGTQLFEEMEKYSDQEGKDVRTCDWKVWKTGTNKATHYWSSRQDASSFTINVTPEQINTALKEAVSDSYTPLKDDELERKLLPLTAEQAKAAMEKESAQGNAPTAPALPGQTSDSKSLPAHTADPLLAAMRAMFPSKTDDEIRQIIAAAATPAGGTPPNFQGAPQGNNPAAQQTGPTTPAPKININQAFEDTGDPSVYVLVQGKHEGKKLGDLMVSDVKYVEYLRAQGYDDVVKHLASKLLDAKPKMPEATKAPESTPVPTTPPVTQPDGRVVQVEQPVGQVSEVEGQRLALAKECKGMVSQVKDFQGPGLSRNFIPLLKTITSAKRLNYMDEWTVPELQVLKVKLNEKLGNVPANPQLSA